MNHWVAVDGPMATQVELDQHSGLASHPACNCALATPNHASDGELIRGEAATIAPPQVPAVDHTPVFSPGENAIAKEPVASYPERGWCVS